MTVMWGVWSTCEKALHVCTQGHTRKLTNASLRTTPRKWSILSEDHGMPESLHREGDSWSELWKYQCGSMGKLFPWEGAFSQRPEAVKLSGRPRKQGAVMTSTCGWVIGTSSDSVSDRFKRYGAPWDIPGDCHSGGFCRARSGGHHDCNCVFWGLF